MFPTLCLKMFPTQKLLIFILGILKIYFGYLVVSNYLVSKSGLSTELSKEYKRVGDVLQQGQISVEVDNGGVMKKCTTQTGLLAWIISEQVCTEDILNPSLIVQGTYEEVVKIWNLANRGDKQQLSRGDGTFSRIKSRKRMLIGI